VFFGKTPNQSRKRDNMNKTQGTNCWVADFLDATDVESVEDVMPNRHYNSINRIANERFPLGLAVVCDAVAIASRKRRNFHGVFIKNLKEEECEQFQEMVLGDGLKLIAAMFKGFGWKVRLTSTGVFVKKPGPVWKKTKSIANSHQRKPILVTV